jgi:hypothetical protein
MDRGKIPPLENMDEDIKQIIKAYGFLENLLSVDLSFEKRHGWEDFYQERLSQMECKLGLLLESPLPKKGYQKLLKRLLAWRKELDAKFVSFYKQQRPGRLPLPAKGMAILFDGMRWDLWEEMKNIIWIIFFMVSPKWR